MKSDVYNLLNIFIRAKINVCVCVCVCAHSGHSVLAYIFDTYTVHAHA